MAKLEESDLLSDTKCIINSLVIPYPKGLTLRKLCQEFRDSEGTDIPYRELGFSSLTAFLKSMPEIRLNGNLADIHTVVLFPVANESTQHIIALVKGQKKEKDRGPPLRRPAFNFGGNGFNGFNRAPNRGPNTYHGAGRGANRPRFNLSNGGLTSGIGTGARMGAGVMAANKPANTASAANSRSTSMGSMVNKFTNFSITKPAASIPNAPQSQRPFVPMPTATTIQNHRQFTPMPTATSTPSARPFVPMPTATTIQTRPFVPMPTATTIQNHRPFVPMPTATSAQPPKPASPPPQPKTALLPTPKTVSSPPKLIIHPPPQPSKNAALVSVTPSEKPIPSVKGDPNTFFRLQAVPDQIKARVIRLLDKQRPMGMAVCQFLSKYNEVYDELNLRQMRFSDAQEFFQVLATELPIVVELVDGKNRVSLTDESEVREWVATQARTMRHIFPIVVVDTIGDIVLPGETFKAFRPPPRFDCNNNEYVATFISSAISPDELFLQFKGSDYHTALERTMIDLEFYDKAPEERWCVPYEFLSIGLPVITRYPGDKFWHRARINRLYANQKRAVNVTFVDYGGSTVTDYKSLRLMRRDFLALPPQAFKVGLYGVKPILGEKEGWATAARDKILRFSKPYYALATTLIEYRRNMPMVAICDTNTAADIFIHNVLVNDKHAVFDERATMEPNGDSMSA